MYVEAVMHDCTLVAESFAEVARPPNDVYMHCATARLSLSRPGRQGQHTTNSILQI